MLQAIAGVTPHETREVTIMTVWPTVAATSLGRLLGQLYSIRVGIGGVLTVGNLIALLSIPIAIPLFFWGLLPGVARRYRLTNRRLIVQKGLSAVDAEWVALDDFDSIQIFVRPGQEWYRAGDLVFKKGNVETFRLLGVSRPDTFRNTCLEAQRAHASVKRALQATG